MGVDKAMMVAGIGSRKGVSAADVVAAVEAALRKYGLARDALGRLATMEVKREEKGIFEAGALMGLEVVVVKSPSHDEMRPLESSAREIPPPLTPPHKGEGDYVGQSAEALRSMRQEALESPSPLWGGVRGGGTTVQDMAQPPSPSRADARDTSPPLRGGEEPSLSFKLAGVASVSEAAALAAAGDGARLAGPRVAVGPVTCAIAFGDDE
jgi:cobalt-precorrin 5A hydrolase